MVGRVMHKIAEKKWSENIFKAYDIRGKYPGEINEDAAYRIARAFARYLKLGNADGRLLKIAVSADARASSPSLKEAFLEGLENENVEIIDAGITTTPMHYFIVNRAEADGGAMITASHNPAVFNGVKLCKKGAVPIGEGAGMGEIKGDAVRGIFAAAGEAAHSEKIKIELKRKDFLDEYINFFEEKFPELKTHGLKLSACMGNGMATILLPKLFKKFPKIKVKFIHSELDMTFPNHEANPLKAENLKDIQNEAEIGDQDAGVSFDGDGDRVGFVDEKGDIIPGDIVTALLARYFTWKPDFQMETGFPVVYDLRSSRAVREEIERYGMRAVESRVGHAFIKALMRKENAVFGGEVSGHYYFRDFFFCDSAVFAVLAVLDLMRIEKKPLSELVEPLMRYAKSGEINFEVQNKDKAMDVIAAQFQDGRVSYLDGIKVEYWDESIPPVKRWWFNLRPSNTEDLIRLNLEAATPELLEKKKKLLEELLREQG